MSPVPFRTLWPSADGQTLFLLDQTRLPLETRVVRIQTVEQAARAIVTMQVRGAPLIGITAAFGLVLALQKNPSDAHLKKSRELLARTRPTAVNLHWALETMRRALEPLPPAKRAKAALIQARQILEMETFVTEEMGRHGFKLLQALRRRKKLTRPLNLMTHCNTGKFATPGIGTATAPMYVAQAAGFPIHVWVSETRPRLQGALTALELSRSEIPLQVITDNAAGHLIQRGLVDVVIVGADRITSRGDVANKIGTYLKALAARAHGVPFYVAVASNTIDWSLRDGVKEIPIEERGAEEITHLRGERVLPKGIAARNDAFDVTPAHLITGFITEKGVCRPGDLRRFFKGHA